MSALRAKSDREEYIPLHAQAPKILVDTSRRCPAGMIFGAGVAVEVPSDFSGPRAGVDSGKFSIAWRGRNGKMPPLP
uniref:Uncharacterized protein n=1 Tax=Candidatus Kentrum sp. SD TaxID=2126332 RepID=A0A451BPM9_9GAMM|nr:MAG: hypothetical protein BECKSD772F_GA0070984_109212 [Candidatus Kentron sp. SD]VFK47258.1 MAG: hypothetical protein BECKSD772E_GA0070983_109012 [Candidatus Kentron sp. SD]VFK80252.1 MAG: hypothetical protein BECKSD772D_GA0070982_109612 [Candidatus Kentron sp. SD]